MKRLEWRSLRGWEVLTEFDLRDCAKDMFDLDPTGKLLPIARAVVASPYYKTRFGGREHVPVEAAATAPELNLNDRVKKLTKAV